MSSKDPPIYLINALRQQQAYNKNFPKRQQANMATPFWGNLDPLPVTRQNTVRRSSNEANIDSMQSQLPLPPAQSKPNRTSLQSQAPTVSTQSPFASPTVSSFQAEGLAPRPPSFPYGAAEGANRDYAERRRWRVNHDTEQYYDDKGDSGPPPAAPDAPRPPPPLSYKHLHGAVEQYTPYSVPARSRSTRRPEGPTDATQIQPVVYRERRSDSRDNIDRDELNTGGEYKRDRISIGDIDEPNTITTRKTAKKDGPEYHKLTTYRTKNESTVDTEAQRRREWAPDRSPLQRLELTLDSITKGEKRARIEEAEFLARQAKAGRGGERVSQNAARFRNRPVSKESEKGVGPEPQSLHSVGLVRNITSKQKDELQSGTVENRKPAATDSDQERQLGKGFEPQRQGEVTSVSTGPIPDPEKSINTSGSTFGNRVTVLSTTSDPKPIVSAAIFRTASNKLKKEPPGDPWYSKRLEAEMAAQQMASRRQLTNTGREPGHPGGPLTSAPVGETKIAVTGASIEKHSSPSSIEEGGSNSDEVLPHVSIRGNSSKKIEQLTGHKIGAGPVGNISFSQQQLYVNSPDKQKELVSRKGHENSRPELVADSKVGEGIRHSIPPDVTDGDYDMDKAARGLNAHLRPNIIDFNHHRRSQYEPGAGIYTPSQRLDEWKNAGVAALTGSLLDLKIKQTVIDKDKAWWEKNRAGKQKQGTTRQKNIESYDGGYENNNGMVFSTLSQPVTKGMRYPAPSVVMGLLQNQCVD